LQDSDDGDDNIPFSQLKEKRKEDKPQPLGYVGDVCKEKASPFIVLITETETETEEQVIATVEERIVVIDEVPTGESCIGQKILKEFGEGLFKGSVTTAIKKRGRFLYHVVYEDGDEEDLNDKEFREGYELLHQSNNDTLKTVSEELAQEDSDNDNDKSGGDTEGSEYDMSEDEDRQRKRKKRRTKPIKSLKEKAKNMGENNDSKEEDTPKRRHNKVTPAVDVQALIKSGGKQSVTNRTIASMSTEEQATIIGTAEKTIIKEAKKGLRKEAMKVCHSNYQYDNVKSFKLTISFCI
jgi:hypothetical protein